MDTSNFPALPTGNVWAVQEFLNNEIQWYTPGTRVVLSVQKTYRILGLTFRLRDTTYPAYVVDATRGEEPIRNTADLILERHETYLRGHKLVAGI